MEGKREGGEGRKDGKKEGRRQTQGFLIAPRTATTMELAKSSALGGDLGQEDRKEEMIFFLFASVDDALGGFGKYLLGHSGGILTCHMLQGLCAPWYVLPWQCYKHRDKTGMK